MYKRLQKIDEFLDSLEKGTLSAAQTSYILSSKEWNVEAGDNITKCSNSAPGLCGYNDGACVNKSVSACSGSTNIGSDTTGCVNKTMDYAPACSRPTNPNTDATCSSVSNMIGTSCAG